MKIYGLTVVCSEGYGDGRESYTMLFTNATERLNETWRLYTEEVDLNGEWLENAIETLVEFAEKIGPDGYVYGQWPDYHMQWEFFEQEI